MTWVRLIKSVTHNGKKFPRGRIINFDSPIANELSESGSAEMYNGPRPPLGKMKTDLFKPKI